jgi:hypothetical protein
MLGAILGPESALVKGKLMILQFFFGFLTG